MLKETITYVDYDGTERTEDFYFNLTKAELLQMELSVKGGFHAYVEKITKAVDVTELIKLFKDLIEACYGVKSPDGRKFIKNQEVLDDFKQTEAYSELFMKLATDADAASRFVNGVFPASLQAEVQREMKNNPGTMPQLVNKK